MLSHVEKMNWGLIGLKRLYDISLSYIERVAPQVFSTNDGNMEADGLYFGHQP